MNHHCFRVSVFISAATIVFSTAGVSLGQHVPVEEAVPGAVIKYAPGPRYVARGIHRWIFGTEYRHTWAIPIEIEVMDIGSYRGGLTPLKKGGFGQTTSLHMVDASGVRHVFRSLDKDPARGLPDYLQDTFVADVMRDQISSQHPYASLIVPKLLEPFGTLHVTPHLYVMPNDPRLGEFREEFAGLIGAIEERPDDGPDGERGFAGSNKVSSSSGMYDDLEKHARNRVDDVEFLEARLLDAYLGDRDRHFDQWRWARMDGPNGTYRWLPIPKDRDQAFKVNDGLMMSFLRRLYVSFSAEYPNIEVSSFNGRELDRRLLVNLSRPVWDSVAANMQILLTDEVIESAVHDLPKEIYEYHGARLEQQLKSRRDEVPEMADKYYALLAKFVDLHSSDDDDIAEIDRNADGSIRVQVRTTSGIDYFDRTFYPSETKEVRVLTHGGKDSLIVRGDHRTSIKLRILPGGNDDVVIDESSGPTRIYDDRGENRIVKGRDTSFDDSRPHHRHPDELFLPPAPTDYEARKAQSWGQYWFPTFMTSYTPDLGLVAGAGVRLIKHGFRRQPYNYRWSVSGRAATAGRGLLRTDLHFPDLAWKLKGDVEVEISSMDLVSFYGFGNDFSLDGRDGGDDYFDVLHTDVQVTAGLTYSLAPNLDVTLGPRFRFVNVGQDEANIVAETPYFGVEDDLALPSAVMVLEYDTRDNPGAAAKGVNLVAGGELVPVVIGASDEFDTEPYGRINGSAAVYLSPNNKSSNPILALRVGGEKVFGDIVPFYDAAFIGGSHNLRGYRSNRYAGDASAYGNAELRVSLTSIRFIVPWELGVSGLFDAGRVWLDADDVIAAKSQQDEIDEDKIHTAYGGGIWLGILNRRQTVSFSVANGEDDLRLYVRAGFHF